MITRGRWQRGQPGLTSMPPEVLQVIIAACPDQQEARLALQQTCRALRQAVDSARTTLELRHFGRSGQVAPLLQHYAYAGVQHIVLGSCGAAAVPWYALEQLRRLRSITIPLAAAVSQLQPLSSLRQLLSLTFTSSQYGEATAVPLAAVASLTRLTMLNASTCAPLDCPELQCMAVMQHLEVLRMPCSNPWALASLAVQLPRLRSLDLRLCCGYADTAEQLSLSAATALTELRMATTTGDTFLVQQMVLPPRLKALHLDLIIKDKIDGVIAFLNALPLERLASLSVDGSRLDPDWDYNTPLRLLTGSPPLTQLTLDSTTSFDRLYRFLHPLITKAAAQYVCPGPIGRLAGAGAQAAAPSGESGGGGSGWCLRLTCGGLEHELWAADILQREERRVSSRPATVVHGCLVSATFLPDALFRTVQTEGPELSVLRAICTHETRLRRLAVHTRRGALVRQAYFANPSARLGLTPGFLSGGDIASLKSLEHLSAPGFDPLDAGDCAALAAHPTPFTFLHLSPVSPVLAPPAGLARALHAHARSLRDLAIAAHLSAGTLAVLQPLVALTRLCLGHTTTSLAPDPSRSRSWEDLDGHTFSLRRLETEDKYNLSTPDHEFAAALPLMPWLQELRICGSANLTGSGLAVLPDVCPLLRVLSLSTLPRLRVKHLRCVKRLEDLAVLDLCEVPLPKEAMRELARVLPPNLQALTLRRVHANLSKTPWLGCDMKPEDVPPLLDAGLAAFLSALPTPVPPLRHLSLQRKCDMPFRGPALAALTAAAAKLPTLERLDFSELDVAANELHCLRLLPALVELNAIRSRGFDTQHGGSLQPRLDELRSAFALLKRPLLAVETKEEDGSHLWDPHDA